MPDPAVTPADPLDPALLDRAEVRAALTARDVGAVYRLLGTAGVTQRQIARLTQQSQSEVSAIVQGRRVRDVEVLERIADGLGAPRAWMRLGYGEDGPDTPSGEEEADGEMKRRALIAATTAAVLGQVVQGLGELAEVALPGRQSLPARLGMVHVHTVRAVTEQLRGVARQAHPAIRRSATTTADAADHRAGSPTRHRQPRASPAGQKDRHDPDLAGAAGRCVAGTLQCTEQSKWYIPGNEMEACSVLTTALSRPDGRRGNGGQ